MLTNKEIENLPTPKKGSKKYLDHRGLCLRIFSNGTKRWIYRYSYYGKQKELALGIYPFISLKQARIKHSQAMQLLAEGKDPCTEKQREKQQKKAEILRLGNTFAEIANQWYEIQLKNNIWKNKKHGQQVINTLKTYAFPYFGNQPVENIKPYQIYEALLNNISKKETIIRTKQRIKAVFDYAIFTERCTYNPVASVPKITKDAANHQPALPKEKLPEFFRKLEAYDSPTVRLAIKFLIITFVRSGELRLGEWSEIKGNEWHIPKEKMKMKRPHIVPLSNWALEILEELKSYSKNNLIIHGARKRPLSDNALSIALRRMGYKGIATPHGFRAMASTILNESGLFTPDAIERQLAHAEQNKIRDAYNRGDYLEERHRMMQWYSDYIQSQYLIAKGEL